MRRKKSEPMLDETVIQYLYWTEDDRKWDRIRRLKTGGITEITEEDRLLQRAWSGMHEPVYRDPDTTRPYVWTPKLQDERCKSEEIRRMIVDAKVDGDFELVDALEAVYDKLARKVQARIDRAGGCRHTTKAAGYSNKDLHEPNDKVVIISDYKRDYSNEDEEDSYGD